MPVFDYDSSHLTHMIRTMVDKRQDPNGNEIHGPPPQFNVGVAANPGADPIERGEVPSRASPEPPGCRGAPFHHRNQWGPRLSETRSVGEKMPHPVKTHNSRG